MATLNFNSGNNKSLAVELESLSQEQPMELVLPCLYSELESNALKNILNVINKVNFLKVFILSP